MFSDLNLLQDRSYEEGGSIERSDEKQLPTNSAGEPCPPKPANRILPHSTVMQTINITFELDQLPKNINLTDKATWNFYKPPQVLDITKFTGRRT